MKNKMIKKITATALSLITIPCLAEPTSMPTPMSVPEGTIKIVSSSEMHIDETSKQLFIENQRKYLSKGYMESSENADFVAYLLAKKKSFSTELKGYQGVAHDSHLKSSLSEIKLSFDFKNPPFNKDQVVIGYSALGAELENGWTGVGILFSDENIGVCSYKVFNIGLTHGSVQLSKESTEYLVNNKPSVTFVAGTTKTGFIYSLNWYEPGIVMHQMDCANMAYNPLYMKNIIALAKKIDLSNNQNKTITKNTL